jgi:uncharacterized protein (DUF1015 family)
VKSLQAANPQHTGNEEYNFFQCVLFPADQLQILPYNRAVKDLNGYTVEDFLKEIGRAFEVTPDAAPQPETQGTVCNVSGRALVWAESLSAR